MPSPFRNRGRSAHGGLVPLDEWERQHDEEAQERIDRFNAGGRPLPTHLNDRPEDDPDVADAMSRYTSQISSFWPDPAAMDAAVRAFARRTGGEAPAERLWRVV